MAVEPRTFSVSGMTCSSCVNSIEKSLKEIEGVSASVNFATETVHILAPAEVKSSEIIKRIKGAGYSATLVEDGTNPALQNRKSGRALFFAALFALPTIVISMVHQWHERVDEEILRTLDSLNILPPLYSPTAWLAIGLTAPLILIVALPIHRAALRNIFHPTMDSLISLGSLSAFGWSIYSNTTGDGDVYTEIAAGVLLFVILGRYLESRAKHRASSALSTLLALGAKEVTVLRNGLEVIIPISELAIGDDFVVKAGARIATDGLVISGVSSVNNSMITGESTPVEVLPGSRVIGASLNNNGRIIVRATRVGSDTEFARITAMVVQAQGVKAPIQRVADRISSIFVPVVTALAIATFFAWYYLGNDGAGHSVAQSIQIAITVLVIACPCALGLATPVALLVASGRGASRGIVLRQPRVLELARKVDVVVLDKTGTLTTGVMKVIEATIPTSAHKVLGPDFASFLNEKTILATALSLELANDHPVGQAISSHALSKGAVRSEITDFAQTPGAGVAGRVSLGAISPVVLIGSPKAIAHSATAFDSAIEDAIAGGEENGYSVAVLAWDGVAIAVFAIGDQVKADAASTISALIDKGITPWLVTGDNEESAAAIARTVGIKGEHVIARALPEEKLARVNALKAAGHTVLMIGDGINDAAALAAADLSMAMGTGTDTAISSADITLMRPELMSAVEALTLSKRTLTTIKSNLGWAFAYNVIGLPIAAAGLLTPMYAAAAMAVSSLFVVTNSLRIK
ncbi:MAG: heavy metal translocating P-type ATPase [Candidatus Planktophila sp.]|nr:heavy metal translocating P-type ATPase [Candidatus Planktophila sp.]